MLLCFKMPNVTRPTETQRLVPPSNTHVQSTCDPSFSVPGYVSGVQQWFDCYDTHPELFPESRAINSTDPCNRLVQERSLPRPVADSRRAVRGNCPPKPLWHPLEWRPLAINVLLFGAHGSRNRFKNTLK